MNSNEILWIQMDSYGFLWIPVDSCGFLWLPMDFYGFLPAQIIWCGPAGQVGSALMVSVARSYSVAGPIAIVALGGGCPIF
jgi:hypothetical protein